MRFSSLIVLAALLGACGGPEQVSADTQAEPAKSVMETQAEKVCAEMTSFRADDLAGKSLDVQAKLRREFDLCVSSVSNEEAPPADAPALRGRTTAP